MGVGHTTGTSASITEERLPAGIAATGSMVSKAATPNGTDGRQINGIRHENGGPTREGAKGGAADGTPRQKKENIMPKAQDVTELKDYQLGDCLGKGAFGSVFRALNMGTGETVAVKQVKLVSKLRSICLFPFWNPSTP